MLLRSDLVSIYDDTRTLGFKVVTRGEGVMDEFNQWLEYNMKDYFIFKLNNYSDGFNVTQRAYISVCRDDAVLVTLAYPEALIDGSYVGSYFSTNKQ